MRKFKSSWDNPGTTGDVANYAGEGKAVAWSAKPPAWSGSCPQNLSQPGYEACSGTSPWDGATAAATSGTVTMRSMIRQLQDLSGGSGEPSFHTITISHEPHDNAIDTAQGWNNGNASRKCGASADPGLGVDLNSDGDFDDPNEFEPCAGFAQDFKDMYAALRTTRNNSCDEFGATTGTGYACSRVKIQYIGVTSRLTDNSGGGVGSGDPMRPASTDFDILGADPYNYGCYDNGSSCNSGDGDGDGLTDGGWEEFENMVDKQSSSNSLLDLAAALNKRVILDEVGSHPGCTPPDSTNKCNNSTDSTSRSTWMDNAYTYMTTDAEAKKYIIGWIYFHVIHTYEWRFMNYGAVNPDSRGRTSYTNNFAANTKFLDTANGYVLDLTP